MTQAQLTQLQAQIDADQRVALARRAYQSDQSQTHFNAYLDALKPYLSQVDQSQYGIDPASGRLTHTTSKKGHLITMAGGMAAGAAAPYVIPALAGGGGGAGAAGGGGTAASTQAGSDWAAVLEGGGTSATSSSAGRGTGFLRRLAGLAGPTKDAIQTFLENRRVSRGQDQIAEAERQRQAVEESKLDPFRGQMMQSHDVAQLDWMANQDNTAPPVQLDAKYGAGLSMPAPRSYGPSPETRALLRAASSSVAAGDSAPPITPGTQPLPVVKRKKNPDDPNAWLYT